MICPACGANLADDLKFCTQCGTALEAAPVVEEPIAEAPVVEEPVAEVACDACAFEPEAAQEPVFDAEIAPEAFDQLPEEVAEPEQPADKKPLIFGIVSLVLGILSIPLNCCTYTMCVGIPFVIVAVVMGIVGIIFSKKAGNKTALILSIAGIAAAALSIITTVIMIIAGVGLGAAMGLGEMAYYY